jgi:transglutaminase-like putative cysteine protease
MWLLAWATAARGAGATDAEIQAKIERGSLAEAQRLLREKIADPEAPATTQASIQLELLSRIRYDFSATEDDVLRQIRNSIPDVTADDLQRWRETGDLQYREIDGQVRYFRRAVSNLFRFNSEARRRRDRHAPRTSESPAQHPFDLTEHVARLVELSESAPGPEICPVKHRVTYTLWVRPGHPRLTKGALVEAWLPFPQHYRQQRDVKLLTCQPAATRVSDNRVPHRTIYFCHEIDDPTQPPRFHAEYEFVTWAYCPKLDPARVQPYDTGAPLYRRQTAERPPHIVFTPEVRRIAAQIVGQETNPLRKAVRIFRWVSDNVPWCAELEYSIIPNLSAKGLAARRGDCGVQGMVFITLCRAAGVPARWQSGWVTKPGAWNMHDWSEFYVEPWGWLPADASYGVQQHPDPRVQDFFCGRLDPYRLIVNLDYGRDLQPPKTSFRSEPNDFQRGEVEIDGHNLYYDQWQWTFDVETDPLPWPVPATVERAENGSDPESTGHHRRLTRSLDQFRRQMVNDPRLFPLDVRAEWIPRPGVVRLTGHVAYQENRRALVSFLQESGFACVENRVELLPSKELGNQCYGLIRASHSLTYDRPGGQRQVVTDGLLGSPLYLLKQAGVDCYLVQGVEGYLGYVAGEDIVRVDRERFRQYQSGAQVRMRQDVRTPDGWLVPVGARLRYVGDRAGQVIAELPQGGQVTISAGACQVHDGLPDPRVHRVIEAAARLLKTPYRWGGNSSEGIDCSGLVQVAFAAAGIGLPRDSNQQMYLGSLTATRWYRDGLRPGDTLYFLGQQGKVSHTAIYVGDDLYLEAVRPVVRYTSFNPRHQQYDPRRAAAFCFAKRLLD